MAVLRTEHSGIAPQTTLSADLLAGGLVFTVISGGGTGYPTGAVGKFIVTIDSEKIRCLSRSGDTFTIAAAADRGVDGTTAAFHATGSKVTHTISAYEYDEFNRHAADTTIDDHTQYLTAGRHSAISHLIDAELPAPGTPSDVQKITAWAGTASAAARADHRHGVLTAAAGSATVGATAAEGTAGSLARSDHVHGVAAGTPGTAAIGDAAAAGSATTFARSDHTHAVPGGTPGTSMPGNAAAAGTATTHSRSDHVHGREAANVSQTIAASETTASTVYGALFTAGPTVTITTTSTRVLVGVVGTLVSLSGGGSCYMSYAVSGATTIAAADSNALIFSPGAPSVGGTINNAGIRAALTQVVSVTPGTNTFSARYRSSSASTNANFTDRQIWVAEI